MAFIRVVDVEGNPHDVVGEVGSSIMESLRKLDFGVAALCGGMCSCATCHVFVSPAWIHRLPPREEDELLLVQELSEYRSDQSRLSCQIIFEEGFDGIELEIAPED